MEIGKGHLTYSCGMNSNWLGEFESYFVVTLKNDVVPGYVNGPGKSYDLFAGEVIQNCSLYDDDLQPVYRRSSL